MKSWIWIGVSLLPFGALGLQGTPPAPSGRPPIDFEGQIKPILKAKCYSCHAGDNLRGNLDLSNPAGILKVVRPGNANQSELFRRITIEAPGKPLMPMGFGKLAEKEFAAFRDWIDQGASFAPVPSFDHDILPIFKAHCGGCHGGGEKLSGGLNLLDGKGVYRVVSAGNPAASELVKRVRGQGGKPQMPMGFQPLSADKIELIERWIKVGAPATGVARTHWAYIPVSRPAVPTGTGFTHPVDAFIVKRLREEGLSLSKPATREALLRRVSLDLIGLPPTPAEIDQFVADSKPGAYERVVDRLLANPQYGVRMARPWLDLARYADTNGYEKDNGRSMWVYRDWVVQALNRNLPFDQFTVEQLAGDLLPGATQDQFIATGFNRNTMHNLEGGVDQDEAMYQVIGDRVATTSVTWLGQTLACAQCHDHKYDPLSQKDYFRFYAFFNRNEFEERGSREISEMKYFEPQIRAATADQAKRFAEIAADLARLDESIGHQAQMVKKEGDQNQDPRFGWVPFSKPIRQTEPENVIRVSGSLREATGLRITSLPLDDLPGKGAGFSSGGNFILSKIVVRAGGRVIPLVEAAASYCQGDFSPRGVMDDDPDSGWAVYRQESKSHRLAVNFAEAVTSEDVTIELRCESKTWSDHFLMSFQIEAGNFVNSAATVLPAARFAEVANVSRPLRIQKESLLREKAAMEAQIPTALVMKDRKADGPLTAPVRHRGEFLSPGELVEAATPAALGSPVGGNRLSLANWLVDRKNPLTPRVQANRLWELFFGRGIVETSENFGTQGTPPTHPELLDWLAAKYVESDWDTKAMVRLIVTSNAYRQRSESTPALLAKDPENRLLARAPRFRLEAETIRDSALRAAGLLSLKLGGPSVFPDQPDGVWDSPYSGEQWMESEGDNRYRRSLYTFYKRTAPYPLFKAFDAGSRETCLVRRTRTNTPLQSLALLNDVGLFEAAKALGRVAETDGVSVAFRRVTGRRPDVSETARLEKLVTTLAARFDADPASAAKLGGPTRAAWTGVGNVLLNLDEAISKE